ncbi:GroES-like protein [Suhomyces tanzawaensis NRRL Y-17324]|uniref:GroES-like protein n=1 Tax=Suhomyces tanzawaensis NRRL Y-17324 TaxID=984487 RepID=A0A1E4SPZ7_9ASCO|nr:GroES-like protein [Suhomyces tanzawaensis NRRL Y-17324]ODV81576.1 GroES-like protein [Suhomyces tanzawaensis NRRL Y-17324]
MKQAILLAPSEPDTFVQVGDGPVPQIDDNKILVKAVAYAANPCDWKHRGPGWGHYGAIAGTDASGIVLAVGRNVTGFEEGDHVSTFLRGNLDFNRGAWAEYVVADPATTINYKKTLSETALPMGTSPSGSIASFEGAASVTLSLATVAVSLSHSINIPYNKQENASRYILIWGGATSASVLAIQVAKLVYGLKVITTASQRNHEFLRSLGADEIFDYNDAAVVEDIKRTAAGNISFALDAVATPQTFQQLYDSLEGSQEVWVDNLSFMGPESINTDSSRNIHFGRTCAYFGDGNAQTLAGHLVPVFGGLTESYNQFWTTKLPEIVSQLKTSNLLVLEPGLESANQALHLLSTNKVSAQKIVWRGNSA